MSEQWPWHVPCPQGSETLGAAPKGRAGRSPVVQWSATGEETNHERDETDTELVLEHRGPA